MSCIHLEEFKSSCGLESYEIICSTIIAPSRLHTKAAPEALINCFDCEEFNNSSRLVACLHCIYFGCYENHIMIHSSTAIHPLCVELSNGHAICLLCEDVVYDSDVDEIMKKCLNDSSKPYYVPWKPSAFESQLLKDHPKRVKIEAHSSIGMRGIMNIGNSCFMNCIIQALLHTPMLRDYFFAEKHICYAKDSNACLYCHFATVFQRYYSDDDPATLSLHEILYLIWQNDSNFCRYEQKDAHEFFICARNLLHQFSSPPGTPDHEGTCKCIVDTIFHGRMQSDLVCLACSNVSTKIDPLWEISLDIPDSVESATLYDCLHHFTLPEPLGENSKISCTACNSYQEGSKQLTFKLLPLVIVIHLKRFEQYVKAHKKKTLYVSFPIDLDMSPFLSGERNKITDSSGSRSGESMSQDHRYSLYAVIVHSGCLNAGHYFSFIRRNQNSWFKCNDMTVEPANIEDVLQSEAYLLFYHKTILPYE